MDLIAKGITLGLLLSIAVGPVLFSIIKQSINNGIRGGLAFVAGVSLSDLSLAIASNFFTEVFSTVSTQTTIIGLAGSSFLIAVGIYFLVFKKVPLNAEGSVAVVRFRKRDYLKMVLAGFLMNILNPMILLFWIGTATTFIEHTLRQRLSIFAIALGVVLVADVAKVLLANRIRGRLTPHNIQLVNRLNGIILIGFGAVLAVSLLFYTS